MKILSDIARLKSGSPQFRIKEVLSEDAPTYYFYGQSELGCDLSRLEANTNPKQVRTYDEVTTLMAGDLVFSLISGQAAIVLPCHNGYLLTQNYVKVIPCESVDVKYLAYMLNEDENLKRQLLVGQQGSATMKFTINRLAELQLPNLPPKETQKAMGKLYFSQLKRATLKTRLANTETLLIKLKLKEALQS